MPREEQQDSAEHRAASPQSAPQAHTEPPPERIESIDATHEPSTSETSTGAAPAAAAQDEARREAPLEHRAPRIKIGSQRETSNSGATSTAVAPRKVRQERVEAPTTETPAVEPNVAPPRPAATSPAAPTQRPAAIPKRLSPELEQELAEALGDAAIDELLDSPGTSTADRELAPQTRHRARVLSVHGENVFVDLGVRNQGVVPTRQFDEPPQADAEIDVLVQRFDAAQGLYDLSLPGAGVSVADWSQLSEGLLIDVRVSGHNKGGLECEVHGIRGFIPASHVALYHIENLEELVGERMTCLVTEVSPRRKRLVLSRRAVLERERQEAREKLLAELAPGQIRDGVVRTLRDYGAFVDLGGVDGLLHVSQLSWSRVGHPKEVLQPGQRLQVKVLKVDKESGKISLGLRDLLENPWSEIANRYAPGTDVLGKVTKLLDFGALVELEPGVEGMVHISELAPQHVRRVQDVVSAGQEVNVRVLSVDTEAKRIALSLKALAAPAKEAEPETPEPKRAKHQPKKRQVPLRGGTGGGQSEGDRFGLRW